jgi:hypothetical protein
MDNSTQALQSLTNRIAKLEASFRSHTHDGSTTPKLSQGDINPSIRASGNITMSTDKQTYNLGLIDNPTQIQLYGIVVHTTSGAFNSAGPFDIRAIVVGNAQLGKSFYFQPQSSNSVTAGGLPENIIQSSVYYGNGTGGVHALTGEEAIIDVEYPSSGTIVARATVTKFDNDHVEVYVSLAAGWGIIANFVVT